MNPSSRSLLPVLALACVGPAFADGSEALGIPSISIEASGTSTILGAGLTDGQPGTIEVSLPMDAAVTQVLAYWDGLDSPSDAQGDTDTIQIGGYSVTGTRIGGPANFWASYQASAYRADITGLSLVGPGESSIGISGLDFTYETNGLALVVITEDDRIFEVRDGLDYTYGGGLFSPPYDVTVPVVYEVDASGDDRAATIDIIVGGVAESRPSVVEIWAGDQLVVEAIDLLAGNVGARFDVHSFDITVPAGETEVTVHVISEDRGGAFAGNSPASLTWLYSGLSVDDPADEEQFGCSPCFWGPNWWRWDPWCTEDNFTESVLLTDGFNTTFGVSSCESGMWWHARLWHGIVGWGNWWHPARRFLNREAVAAIANADSNINYPYTVAEVIALYQSAVDDGPWDADLKDVFSAFHDANRLGCPW